MIPGVVARQRVVAPTPPPAVSSLVFPMTYDEMDAANSVSLTRSGGAGPHVTPDGFEGDGYSARYTYTSVPTYVSGASSFTLAFSAKCPLTRLGSASEDIVSICENSASANQTLGLSVVADPRSTSTGAIAVRAHTGTQQQQIIGRPGWRYELRSPVLDVGGITPKPQGVLFLDSDTILFSVHLDDTESRVYKVRLSDSAVLGEFTFGTTTHRHIAAFARRANNDLWAGDYETNKLLRIDLDASISSGTAVILQTYDASVLAGVGAIEFAEISGTEYLLMNQYSTTETDAYLYVVPATELASSPFALGDRTKRFLLGRRVQGIAMRSGSLMVARNSLYGGAAGVNGYIQRFDIAGMVASLADDQAVNSTMNASYLTGEWFGPCSYVEDLAIHPLTNDLFTPTEGAYTVGDFAGYLGLWSSNLDYVGVVNNYVLQYNGSGSIQVAINGKVWGDLAWTPTALPQVLSIGGLPAASAGFAAGFSWATVSNLALQDQPLSPADYTALFSGSFESSALTAYELSMTNPGANTGDTTGWTVESGGMTVRTTNPLPYDGSHYFTGGSFVSSVSRQRLALSAAGIANADLDTGLLWGKIRWKQAAFDNNDPGGMGLRMLNGASGTISTTYSPLAYVLGGAGSGAASGWYPRCYPVTLPTLTRSVDALYNASGRTSGTANDHYVDAITVTVYKP